MRMYKILLLGALVYSAIKPSPVFSMIEFHLQEDTHEHHFQFSPHKLKATKDGVFSDNARLWEGTLTINREPLGLYTCYIEKKQKKTFFNFESLTPIQPPSHANFSISFTHDRIVAYIATDSFYSLEDNQLINQAGLLERFKQNTEQSFYFIQNVKCDWGSLFFKHRNKKEIQRIGSFSFPVITPYKGVFKNYADNPEFKEVSLYGMQQEHQPLRLFQGRYNSFLHNDFSHYDFSYALISFTVFLKLPNEEQIKRGLTPLPPPPALP